jgi:hypothetical protein
MAIHLPRDARRLRQLSDAARAYPMPLTWLNLSRRRLGKRRPTRAIERECECSKPLRTDSSTRMTTQFRPLDPAIVNDTIPAFFVGRNLEGFWIARDAKGQIGGIFLIETFALSFARRNSESGGCAIIFPSERIELDLENRGNPLARPLALLIRLMRRSPQALATFIRKTTVAVSRLLSHIRVR